VSKSTFNLDKRIAEYKFYTDASILVRTPNGQGVFYGTTYSRNPDTVVSAKICYGGKIMVLVPLSDVEVIPSGGAL